jgi:hypothetical protein
MNDSHSPDDSGLQTEALALYHSIQLAALEEMVSKIGDVVFRAPSGKKMTDILRELRAKNIRNIPRHLADTDPTRASKLLAILEAMNRGEAP